MTLAMCLAIGIPFLAVASFEIGWFMRGAADELNQRTAQPERNDNA